MSADDFRDEFERIEDESAEAMARIIAWLAAAVTATWATAVFWYLPDIINRI